MMKAIKHYQYKEICLAIKNDLDFEEFSILCSSRNYSDDYTKSIWNKFSEKPLEFVLYHDLGRDVFDYISFKLKITNSAH